MRTLFLALALMVASLGAVAVTPNKADARPPRYWSSYYDDGPYYSSPRYWNGGAYWRGGTVWRPRYYNGPRSYYYGSRYYNGPRGYYYGTYYGPSYYWP